MEDELIIDLGASEHMTYDKSSFSVYEHLSNPIPIRFGNRVLTGQGIGIGEIKIQSNMNRQGKILTMKEVLRVPDLRRKLMSVTAMMNEGAIGNFEDNKIVVKNSQGSTLLIANRSGNLFKADICEIRNEANLIEKDDLTLWHQRLRHVNKNTLERMVENNSVLNMKCDVTKKDKERCQVVECEACTLGKQASESFPLSSRERAVKPGGRVHFDLCGPIGETSITGGKYFVHFKDDYSCF